MVYKFVNEYEKETVDQFSLVNLATKEYLELKKSVEDVDKYGIKREYECLVTLERTTVL
jgi:hypothetical protein